MFSFLNPKIEAFGIDISDLSIKIAKLRDKKSGLVLTSYGRRDIPAGILDRGEIKNENALMEAIQEAARNVKGEALATNFVVCSLPEQEAFIQVIQLPRLNKDEIREAAQWEMEAHIPLKIEEVYFDYFVMKSDDGSLGHIDVLIGALPRKIVDDYVSVLRKSGLRIKAMEIESIATSRALIKNGFSSDPVFIVDLGGRRTSFTVFSNRVPRLTSSSQISNTYLLDILAKELKMNLKEAQQIKFEVGLGKNKDKDGEKIKKALEPSLSALASEIRKYIDFYESHISHEHDVGKTVKEIILCGGGANLLGLSEFLSKYTGLPVKLGNPWVNILEKSFKEIPPISFNESLEYTTALGLALYGIK